MFTILWGSAARALSSSTRRRLRWLQLYVGSCLSFLSRVLLVPSRLNAGSTNKDALNPPPAYIDVSCSTTPGGNAAFDGPPGTSVAVKCPQNCLFSGESFRPLADGPDRKSNTTLAEGAQVIGGEGGVYSDDSSICLAAVHAGALDRSGLVSVRMVQAPSEFEGSDSNGVMSESYMGMPQSRAFRLERVAVKCPKTASSAASSFLEVNVVRDTASLSNHEVL